MWPDTSDVTRFGLRDTGEKALLLAYVIRDATKTSFRLLAAGHQIHSFPLELIFLYLEDGMGQCAVQMLLECVLRQRSMTLAY